MNGLWLVDWGKVHRIFCAIMWLLVLVLAICMLTHLIPPPPAKPHLRIVPPRAPLAH